jgi:hypothetical protein
MLQSLFLAWPKAVLALALVDDWYQMHSCLETFCRPHVSEQIVTLYTDTGCNTVATVGENTYKDFVFPIGCTNSGSDASRTSQTADCNPGQFILALWVLLSGPFLDAHTRACSIAPLGFHHVFMYAPCPLNYCYLIFEIDCFVSGVLSLAVLIVGF